MRRRNATADSFWSPSLAKKLTNVGPRVRNLRGGATSQGLVASKLQRTVDGQKKHSDSERQPHTRGNQKAQKIGAQTRIGPQEFFTRK